MARSHLFLPLQRAGPNVSRLPSHPISDQTLMKHATASFWLHGHNQIPPQPTTSLGHGLADTTDQSDGVSGALEVAEHQAQS